MPSSFNCSKILEYLFSPFLTATLCQKCNAALQRVGAHRSTIRIAPTKAKQQRLRVFSTECEAI